MLSAASGAQGVRENESWTDETMVRWINGGYG